eukprot:4943128-Amphidinium_carterae.2
MTSVVAAGKLHGSIPGSPVILDSCRNILLRLHRSSCTATNELAFAALHCLGKPMAVEWHRRWEQLADGSPFGKQCAPQGLHFA